MIDIYYMNLSGDCSYEQSLVLLKHLTPERCERVKRIRNEEMAKKQIFAGAFMQFCLGNALDIPFDEVKLSYNSHKKPYIENSGTFFNMSHSGDYAVLAVSDSEVGIDIESLRRKRISIAKRFFCSEEYEYILAAGDEDAVNRRFLEYWTMKEAFVKYTGTGLDVPLDSFLITGNGDYYCIKMTGSREIDNYIYNRVALRTFDFKSNYNISICSGDKCALEGFEDTLSDSSDNVKKVSIYDVFTSI